MFKVVLKYILLCLLMYVEGQSQSLTQSATSGYSYYPPHKDKESWQRLNLWLSSTFLVIVKEGQADPDSCLYVASSSIGISRFSILAEGIGDADLLEHSKWIDQRNPGNGIRMLSEAAGRKHLQLMLLLGAYYAFETDSYNRHRDSVDYFLTKAIQESKSLKDEKLGRQALCLLAKIYLQGNNKKGDSICTAVIDQCRKAGDKETEARILAYRGIYTTPLPTTLEKKVTYLKEAAALYLNIGNREGAINVLTDLGYLQMITGHLESAYENVLKAYKLAESIGYPYTHYSTQALASVTIFQGKFGEPLGYVYQTIKTAEITRDSLAWSYFYTSLAQLYSSEGRTKEAFEVAQKSVNRFVADRNTSVYNILTYVVDYMGQEGRTQEALRLTQDIANKVGIPANFSEQYFYHFVFSNCYLNLKMPDLAEVHIKKLDSLEALAAVYRGPLRQSAINTQFACLFIQRKQYQKAREFLEKQVTAPTLDESTLGNKLNTYHWLIFVDSALGDNAAGVAHYKKYIQLLESSFKATKVRQAEELQVIYQMQEKENEIASLTRQAKLEKANSNLVRNLTLAAIFTVLIIAALLYRQNRLKQKSNHVITRKNEQLQDLLADKEWLLREIHHRVKNNLQIVTSLLNSQSVYIDNDAALAAIRDSKRRMHAMALIHQKLYQSENLSSIAMADYINELVNYVRDSLDTKQRIAFKQTIEPLDLDVVQAIPLGLIINESIVNAIKYAFPDGRNGIVNISLQREGTGNLFLKIADNGIGLPSGLDLKAHNSLGLSLVKGLTKQLNGNLAIESKDGLHITVSFTAINNLASERASVNS